MSAQPVVYFIDDSATMREVIKIAFRRENIEVVTCHDGTSAMQMMEQGNPDVVISDVIMPGQDGYEVCQYIKQHPRLGHTPVILMSGVVNKAVAERAFAVRADELIRKPFQPADLITRVRHLIGPRAGRPVESAAEAAAQASAAAALSSIFSGPVPLLRKGEAARPLGPVPVVRSSPRIPPAMRPGTSAQAAAGSARSPATAQASGAAMAAATNGSDAARYKLDLKRLESQIKKLESELSAEREYAKALEAHIKTLSESE